MKITETFKELLFETIEKSLKLELSDQKLENCLTIQTISNAVFNDLVEFLADFNFSRSLKVEEPGFDENEFLTIDDKNEFKEDD